MTRTQLSRYVSMKRSLSLINGQLKRLPVLSDTVQASGREHPYLPYTARVTGMNAELAEQLKRRRRYLREQMAKIEEFVDSLDDVYMRDIIRARYIEGASWVRIGLTKVTQVDGVRKAANRYLKSVCKP